MFYGYVMKVLALFFLCLISTKTFSNGPIESRGLNIERQAVRSAQLRPSTEIVTSPAKVSNLRKYYKPNLAIAKNNIDLLNPKGKVEIINSSLSNYSENILNLYENHNVLMGQSEFNDRKLSENVIKNYAMELGASVVLVASQEVTTNPYSESDDLNELDAGYFYHISFFGKTDYSNKPNILGIQMSEIPRDKKTLYQRNTGVYVQLVVKNSRAYYSNILPGDVIIALNDLDILTPESFDLIKEKELKNTKTLNLTILREVNGTLKEVKIPVSFN